MYWNHSVDPKWLDARRNYITASDIMKLLPVTPTGRPRAGVADALLKVWAKKQCGITEEDINSTGPMARGHLLEPYAFDVLNEISKGSLAIRHWDDCLVFSPDGIACSPDGLDIEQPKGLVEVAGPAMHALQVAEVKAYNAEVHYEVGLSSDPGMLSERWQIATAMYVMPTIEEGVLVLFNPNVRHPLFTHSYLRSDLAAELDIIKEIGKTFNSTATRLNMAANAHCDESTAKACPSEEAIIQELLDAKAVDGGCLNP